METIKVKLMKTEIENLKKAFKTLYTGTELLFQKEILEKKLDKHEVVLLIDDFQETYTKAEATLEKLK